LKRELETITSNKRPTVEDWVYAPENYPFGVEEISAIDARKLSLDEVRSLLSISSNVENGTKLTSVDNNVNTQENIEENKPPKESDVAIKMS